MNTTGEQPLSVTVTPSVAESVAQVEQSLCQSRASEGTVYADRADDIYTLYRLLQCQNADTATSFLRADAQSRMQGTVGAALGISAGAADRRISIAVELAGKIPCVLQALRAGVLDPRCAEVFAAEVVLIDADAGLMVNELLTRILAKRGSWSISRARDAIRAVIARVDPDGLRQRSRPDAVMGVHVRDLGNGVAEVLATLPVADAAAGMASVNALANQVCAGDPRSHQQRRAAAFTALLDQSDFGCTCDNDACQFAGAQTVPARNRTITIIANPTDPRATFTADDIDTAQPALIDGFGVIGGFTAAEIARQRGTSIVSMKHAANDPLRYRPGTVATIIVHARDLRCVWPGCDRPTTTTDLDHTVAFNHHDPAAGGLTLPQNLKCLCRFHHLLKTHGHWHDTLGDDGTLIFTSPSGATYPGPTFTGDDLFEHLHHYTTSTTVTAKPDPPPPNTARHRPRITARAYRHAAERRRHRRNPQSDEPPPPF